MSLRSPRSRKEHFWNDQNHIPHEYTLCEGSSEMYSFRSYAAPFRRYKIAPKWPPILSDFQISVKSAVLRVGSKTFFLFCFSMFECQNLFSDFGAKVYHQGATAKFLILLKWVISPPRHNYFLTLWQYEIINRLCAFFWYPVRWVTVRNELTMTKKRKKIGKKCKLFSAPPGGQIY